MQDTVDMSRNAVITSPWRHRERDPAGPVPRGSTIAGGAGPATRAGVSSALYNTHPGYQDSPPHRDRDPYIVTHPPPARPLVQTNLERHTAPTQPGVFQDTIQNNIRSVFKFNHYCL